jgi:DJ-1/PfpI family
MGPKLLLWRGNFIRASPGFRVGAGRVSARRSHNEEREMAEELRGKKIAVLAADMVEHVELTEPWKALEQAGAELELISIKDGKIQAFNHYDKVDTFKVDKTVEEVSASDYDGLVLPGVSATPTISGRTRTPSSSCASSSSRASRWVPSATRRGCSSRQESCAAGR